METGSINGVVLAAVLGGLFGFGIGYNSLVAWLEREGYSGGYVAYLVAAGVWVTLVAASMVIGIMPALVVLACFAASGLPMIAGSMLRHSQRSKAEQERLRSLVGELLDEEREG